METNVIIESREVDFFENLLSSDNYSLREPQVEIPSFARSQVETPSEDVEISELCRNKTARKEKVLELYEFIFNLFPSIWLKKMKRVLHELLCMFFK